MNSKLLLGIVFTLLVVIIPESVFADNFLVYDAFGVNNLESVSAAITGHYPNIQTDNDIIQIYHQVYITDGFEWSVGAGTRTWLTPEPTLCSPSPCTDTDRDSVYEHFLHYTEADDLGTNYIIYGMSFNEDQLMVPGVFITSLTDTQLCFDATPDELNSFFNLLNPICMEPAPGALGTVYPPAYAGLSSNKYFSGSCEACRGALGGDYTSMSFTTGGTKVFWDDALDNPTAYVHKCHESAGFTYDLQTNPERFQAVFRDELEGSGLDCLVSVQASGPKGFIFSDGVVGPN